MANVLEGLVCGRLDMRAAAGHDRPERDGGDRQPLVLWEEVVGTAAGAALAAFVLSRIGVAGTIVGAACTPVIITLTNATLSPQIKSARARTVSLVTKPRESWWGKLRERLPRGRRLVGAVLTAGAAFLVVAAIITVAEAVVGKPVNDWGHSGGSGYTFTGGGPGSTSRLSTSPVLTHTHTRSQPLQPTSQPARSRPTRSAPPPRSPSSTSTSTAQPTTTPTHSASTTSPTGGAPLP